MSAAFMSFFRVRAAARPVFTPAAVPAYRMLAATGLVTSVLLTARGLRLIGLEWPTLMVLVGFLVALARALRGRGLERIATVIEVWAVWMATSTVLILASYAVGAGGMPLADSALAAADRWLLPGFDWSGTMRALATHPWPMSVANACYESLNWQPGLVLLACAVTGRPERCWTFVLAWTVTLVLVIATFAFTPGLGAYAHFGITAGEVPAVHDATPWTQPVVLQSLRDGGLRAITLMDLKGVVTFPSFHASAAVLLAWAFWPVRAMRWPMASLNAAMLLSAVPIGGHYLVDIPAGILVAVAGIALVTRVEARRAASSLQPVLG